MLRSIYYRVREMRLLKVMYWQLLERAYRRGKKDIRSIPIIINNFNRLASLRDLVTFLEKCGLKRIIILDNNSTYPPLLQYYDGCQHEVVRTGVNYGHLALWKSGLYRKVSSDYFVYTDSDVVPVEGCPNDFLSRFREMLVKYSWLDKAGFGIRIDDLPDSFSLKKNVVEYESVYWQQEIEPAVYKAPIDTTFALYKPFSNLKMNQSYTLPAVRLGPPYVVRHTPWYVDSANLSEEDQYYMSTSNASSSIGAQGRGEKKIY